MMRNDEVLMIINKKDESASQNDTGFETEGPVCNISLGSKKELELKIKYTFSPPPGLEAWSPATKSQCATNELP